MDRRRFLLTSLTGAFAPPLAAEAQPTDRIRRIGLLIPFAESDVEAQAQITAFQEALRTLGWNGERNVRIEYRWAAQDTARIRAFAKELTWPGRMGSHRRKNGHNHEEWERA